MELYLKRPDPVYFAWKNAVNSLWVPNESELSVFQRLNEQYGCWVLKIDRKDIFARFITGVLVKFESEQHLAWFMLKWGNK